MAGLWTSDRLIYRGVDPDHQDFLADLSLDADAYLNSSPLLPVPRNNQTAKDFLDFLTRSEHVLSAIICLPAPEADQQGKVSSNEGKDHEKDKQPKPKPIPIGHIFLHGDPPTFTHHRKCEIGLGILKEYQKQGYGSEAIQWALRWGFKRANLHRIGIGAFAWNTGALRLYERLGFVKEAVKRDFLWHDGQYLDVVDLAMLEDEWREIYDKSS